MLPHVDIQTVLLGKSCFTDLTPVWLFTSVYPLVYLETILGDECATTLTACEVSTSAVAQVVLIQHSPG